jgi:hypothetical protein
MPHTYQAEIKAVISGLRDLSAVAKEQLAGVPALRDRSIVTLRQLDNFLSHIIGEPLLESVPTRKFGPIPIVRRSEDAPEIKLKSAAEMEGEQLRKEVTDILKGFADRDTDEIKDSLSDIQIRGVAKRVGFKVTDTEPEFITTEYIEQIKEKIISDRARATTIKKEMKKISKDKDAVLDKR